MLNKKGLTTRLFYYYKSCIELLKKFPNIIIIDGTFKTNKYKIECLNIGAVSTSSKTISIKVCFLSIKEAEDYL